METFRYKFHSIEDMLYFAKMYFEEWFEYDYFHAKIYGQEYIVYRRGGYSLIAG